MANKGFEEALKDGFQHITDITDPEQLRQLRQDGIQIDAEGYWTYLFGDNKEFELRFEPILGEGMYYVSVYKNKVLLTEKIAVKGLTPEDLSKI